MLTVLYVRAVVGLACLKNRLASQDGYTTWEWLGGGAAIAALFLALASAMHAIDMSKLAQAIVDWMAAALNANKPTP